MYELPYELSNNLRRILGNLEISGKSEKCLSLMKNFTKVLRKKDNGVFIK